MSDEQNTKKTLLAIFIIALITVLVAVGLFFLLMRIPFPSLLSSDLPNRLTSILSHSEGGSAKGFLIPPQSEGGSAKGFLTPPKSVLIGTYEQDNNMENGPEPIEWLLLDENETGCLLISRYVLEGMAYHNQKGDVTWETSSIRQWMNDAFYNGAFSEEERSTILLSDIDNTNTLDIWSSSGGNDTKDYVFALSCSEAQAYYETDAERRCKSTPYCIYTTFTNRSTGYCDWWLRSPGYDQTNADYVFDSGSIHTGTATSELCGVRPAIRITKEAYSKYK